MTRFLLNQQTAHNDFDKLFQSIFNQSAFPSNCNISDKENQFSPKVNVAERDDAISLTFELPGMEKSDIKVLVKDSVLTVSGERKIENEVKSDDYFRSEISSGAFSRSFDLPDTIKTDGVQADYKNGLLHVVLTKKEELQPKEIEIAIS